MKIINWCRQFQTSNAKAFSLRFLKAMIAEWAGYSLIWSRLSHGMNHDRDVYAWTSWKDVLVDDEVG